MSDQEAPQTNPETGSETPPAESPPPTSPSEASAYQRKGLGWKLWAPLVAAIPAVGFVAMPAFYIMSPEPPNEVAPEKKAIVVDLHQQWLYGYEDGQLVHNMPAVTGRKSNPTPTGEFAVGWKSEDYTSREYNAPMPYSMFFVVKRGIAIHGSTAIPWRWRANRLGANMGSGGCVSLTQENAQKLFEWAPPKTPVFVTRSLNPSVMPQTKAPAKTTPVKK